MRTLSIGGILLAILLSACNSVHRYTAPEVKAGPHQSYSSIVVPSRISGVVLEVLRGADIGTPTDSSGTPFRLGAMTDTLARLQKVLVQFDALGGRLLRDSSLLVGTNANGEPVRLPFDSVVSLQYGGIDQGLTLMSVRRALAAEDSVLANLARKVPRGKYGNWNVIEFQDAGAAVDTARGTLTGISRGGIPVQLSLSDVINLTYSESRLKVITRHPYGTARVLVALTIVGIVAFGPANHLF